MSAVFEVRHSLRPMLETDLPRIHRIEQASYDYPWSLGNFTDSLRTGYCMWVREAEGEVVGYYAMAAAAGEAHLLNLTIAPLWRRHGLGRDLLRHCLERACDHRAENLFLEVRTSNTAAIELYRSSGFVDLAVRRAYYPSRVGREDALVMKKDLMC
ncbi:MAG: ribosomal-protein-alanine N-acetyltransferase [Hydrogenophilales bacterium 16-64-46]|nr:MAG: ribosomal-protein-alanine N-acetyltransferase [Hydrogenophilales bacterium 12-64-13]OYZ06384.1 MAG: ribosomal-protein-alanine N-acetyltransferase [Hydrogenophilales bacterium 16-64-46]OZA36590.1 MAG: ribosomal-protein-alanine N-acetyltransferase [Hydrogenophilales bacterium 17-64-34]HQT01384.1 ribosomal protein S18-alanine N-acetyltransferase [Thiobacillus sp.]